MRESSSMNYHSLHKQSPSVFFREATLLGQAPDKGLYFPETIPTHGFTSASQLKGLTPAEIGFQVMKPYVAPSIPDEELKRIVEETLCFPIPLVKVTETIYSLELFHGPTLAFKDVGARFMSRCLGYFSREKKQRTIVLVATSGDTGGAVADGFYGVEGVDVVILFPSGKVSKVQEWQLTTYGGNIHSLEVEGDFDACQKIVKQAFADTALRNELFLTSANSINVARWLPQQMYYFLALQQWQEKNPPVFCVPSGNFGNICAGLMAWAGGLPVQHFLAACNANDVVPRYMQTAAYDPHPAVGTISNAMDVGDPSNFVRVLEIFGQSFPKLQSMFSSVRISDEVTTSAIASVWKNFGYLLDPHGAVAFAALEEYLDKHPGQKGILLETAHPVKFPDSVEAATGKEIEFPEQVKALETKERSATRMPADYAQIKQYLTERFR